MPSEAGLVFLDHFLLLPRGSFCFLAFSFGLVRRRVIPWATKRTACSKHVGRDDPRLDEDRHFGVLPTSARKRLSLDKMSH